MCCCCCRCSLRNDHTTSYTEHALSFYSFLRHSHHTLHTIGTTSHRLFSLGHDGWPFEQFRRAPHTLNFFLFYFISFSFLFYIYMYIFFFYRYIYLLIFVLGRNTRDSFASLVREGRISHLFDTRNSSREKARRLFRVYSASGRSFTVDHQCARATDGQCAESSRSLPFWRGGHVKTTSMGRPSETRQRGYESRETSCLGRVLPHLASFLAFRRVYNAILHIRFDQAQIPKCHPPFLSSVNAESLSPFLLFTLFSSSPTCSSSLSLSLSLFPSPCH